MPEEVERKIRYLIRKFPHTEWSGVLFVTHEGTFENNDLVITCKDIYPMDLGTTGWTEFRMNEDVAAYMAENMELFDCDIALAHSHHTLGAYLSGQDMKMVQQEGNDTNCFVSLVVDTKGEYVAIVTRKVQTKSEITIKNLGTSYEFFGEGSKEITHEDTQTTKVIDREIIEYFDLEVERHEVSNDLEYLDARFEEIEKKKKAKEFNIPKTTPEFNGNFREFLHTDAGDSKEPVEQKLPFAEETNNLTPEDDSKLNEIAMAWQPDPKYIHGLVVRMVTCSFIINPDKIDFKQWVYKHMTNMYGKIFGENSQTLLHMESISAFREYMEFVVQFTIDYFDVDNVPDLIVDNYDVLQSRVASAMMAELQPYLEVNDYMKAYYDELSNYVIE